MGKVSVLTCYICMGCDNCGCLKHVCYSGCRSSQWPAGDSAAAGDHRGTPPPPYSAAPAPPQYQLITQSARVGAVTTLADPSTQVQDRERRSMSPPSTGLYLSSLQQILCPLSVLPLNQHR